MFILAPSCVSGHDTQLASQPAQWNGAGSSSQQGFWEAQELANSGHGLLVSSLCFSPQGVLSLGRL